MATNINFEVRISSDEEPSNGSLIPHQEILYRFHLQTERAVTSADMAEIPQILRQLFASTPNANETRSSPDRLHLGQRYAVADYMLTRKMRIFDLQGMRHLQPEIYAVLDQSETQQGAAVVYIHDKPTSIPVNPEGDISYDCLPFYKLPNNRNRLKSYVGQAVQGILDLGTQPPITISQVRKLLYNLDQGTTYENFTPPMILNLRKVLDFYDEMHLSKEAYAEASMKKLLTYIATRSRGLFVYRDSIFLIRGYPHHPDTVIRIGEKASEPDTWINAYTAVMHTKAPSELFYTSSGSGRFPHFTLSLQEDEQIRFDAIVAAQWKKSLSLFQSKQSDGERTWYIIRGIDSDGIEHEIVGKSDNCIDPHQAWVAAHKIFVYQLKEW